MKTSSVAGRIMLAAGLASLPVAAPAQTAAAKDTAGSRYVQCDGQPNNVTGGETAARLLGAVTLLGLFAPAPEAADASKRKFGAEGVAACSALIDGEKREGNIPRRIGLIMARAIHQIEAKNYPAAIADADLAQKEAETAGYMADPYFARSRGRGFDRIRAAALFRQGKVVEARDMEIRGAGLVKHAFLYLGDNVYTPLVRTASPAELEVLTWGSRAAAPLGFAQTKRLEELGRFKEAAAIREAMIDFFGAVSDMKDSTTLAGSAVTNALAGNRALAKTRAAEARANFEARTAEGKPETDAAEYVELMDLYGIVELADAGDLKSARRLFAARSQWVASSFGTVLEVNRRLRADAAKDELIGGLARDPELLWKERADAATARMLALDSDNKTLFRLIPPVTTAATYETVSKPVWNTAKSKMILDIKPKDGKPRKYDTLYTYGLDPLASIEGYQLHAALLAKARGQQGFVSIPLVTTNFIASNVLTGNRGAPGLPDALFADADQVIADLSPIIPSPEALKARRAAKR